jgi:hypothetical protein
MPADLMTQNALAPRMSMNEPAREGRPQPLLGSSEALAVLELLVFRFCFDLSPLQLTPHLHPAFE